MLRLIRFLICISVFCVGPLLAQTEQDIKTKLAIPDSNQIQILKTKDGSQLIGRIVEIRETEIQFEMEFGEMTIPISRIEDITNTEETSVKGGKYWFPNPNQTRLYFSPTGRMLKKGQGFFADIYVLFPGFAYGVTDNISIGGGMSLVPGVGIENQIFYFTPKIGLVASETINLAVGALILAIPDFDDESDSPFVGSFYGVGTFGPPDHSFTIGLGYGFVEGDLANKPMFFFGADLRMSRRIAFVTENFIFPEVDDPVISYGLRFFGEKLCVDLSFFNPLSDEAIFPGFPYIDFVVNF